MQDNNGNVVLEAIENVKKNVQQNVKNVKSTFETLVNDVNVNQIKSQLKKIVKDAQADLSKMVDRDISAAKKKIAAEKSSLEKEIKKQSVLAKKFIESQKKEVAALQAKLEKLVKKAPAKKATKKVAKKVTKKAPAKKATKKVTKKR